MYETLSTVCTIIGTIDGIIRALEGHKCPTQDKSDPRTYFRVPDTEPRTISFLLEFGPQLKVLPRGSRRNCFVSSAPRFVDACYLLRAELEWLLDYDYRIGDFPFMPCVRFLRALIAWPDHMFVKFAKFHTAAPFAIYTHNEPPENPDPLVFKGRYDCLVWSGPFRRYLKARLCHRNDSRHIRLFWGLLQGVKRGCRVVPPDFILMALADHAEILSKPAPDLVLDTKTEEAWERIKNSSLFQRTMVVEPETNFEASRAASMEHLRSEGGIRQYLRELMGATELVPLDAPKKRMFRPFDRFIGMYETRPGEVVTVRDEGLEESPWVLWPKLFDSMTRHPSIHRSSVKPILEPLKVRLITKGEALPAYFLKPFQVAMWSMLRQRLPYQFSLIGEPLTVQHLGDLLRREMKIGLVDTVVAMDKRRRKLVTMYDYMNRKGFWVSGDYKAATDNLNMHATLKTLEMFLSRLIHRDWEVRPYSDDPEEVHSPVPLGPTELLIAFRSLAVQDLVYPIGVTKALSAELTARSVPFRIENGAVHILMRNGQLMGSILSFPILCFINFWAYYASFLEWYAEFPRDQLFEPFVNPEVSPSQMPVIINGDDIAFRADSRFYEIWKLKIKQFGLKLSIGKNYIHPNLVTINSQLFIYRVLDWGIDQRWTPQVFEEVPFMNVGLLIGQSKLNGQGRKQTLGMREGAMNMPMYGQYNLVIAGACDPVRAHNRFIHYHISRVRHETNHGYYNLFLPPSLYGLGFVNYAVASTMVYTKTQRKLAGYKMSLISSYGNAEWREYATVNELLRGILYVTDEYDPEWPVMERSGASVILSKEDLHAKDPERYQRWSEYVRIRQPPFHGAPYPDKPNYSIIYPPKREIRSILSKELTMPKARALRDFAGDYHVWVDIKYLAESPSYTYHHAIVPIYAELGRGYRGLLGEPFEGNSKLLGDIYVPGVDLDDAGSV